MRPKTRPKIPCARLAARAQEIHVEAGRPGHRLADGWRLDRLALGLAHVDGEGEAPGLAGGGGDRAQRAAQALGLHDGVAGRGAAQHHGHVVVAGRAAKVTLREGVYAAMLGPS